MKLNVEVYDRHAEHVDPAEPLCEHARGVTIRPGDTLNLSVSFEMPGWMWASKMVSKEAQVVLDWVDKDTLRIEVNHIDFLTAREEMRKAGATSDSLRHVGG